jgi:pyrimidine-nucleoside phosphorylase
MTFRAVETIARKRDGLPLASDEIHSLIKGFVDGSVADYQMAAFAMAVYFRGMTADETAALLDAMQHSGDIVRWDDLPVPTADKHSTGGVGDKVSIPLAPAVAACGVAVPMISGRGLGHTGGTLDKLEAIPGFDVRLTLPQFQRMIADLGVSMIGQTDRLVPADKRLYALRDVTATVESIPLITASILSKKLAEGVASLVLDVKVGSGAFMKTRENALELATAMVRAGQAAGRNVTAFLTAMDRPLGTHIGNALEIMESVQILQGMGPADTRELTCRLGGEMLRLSHMVPTLAAGEARIAQALDDGSALAKFRALVQAHGGDPRVCDDPSAVLPRAPVVVPLPAWRSGYLTRMDALEVGLAAVRLGAGRNRSEDQVDPSVGFVLVRKPGDAVNDGETIAFVHASDDAKAQSALRDLRQGMDIADAPVELMPLWLDVVR